MVDKIVIQADGYVGAVKSSVETAQKGGEFAEDAIELCNFLRDGQASIDDLKPYLDDMVQLAEVAHDSALATNMKFRTVRSELFQVGR